MEFAYAYASSSSVTAGPSGAQLAFSPDTLRQPTFFRGDLRSPVALREAISALHDVVVSDLRWQPKDRDDYLAWRAKQDEIDWVEVASQRAELKDEIERVTAELQQLRATSHARLAPFNKAKARYFRFLYARDYDAWLVFDPVITVHPDELFFECFSQDESSYGRLSVDFDAFRDVDEFACGTTNVDYSSALYAQFQKLRSYRPTTLEIDPSGFQVQTGTDASYKEVRIDLPESWVRGFLQVSSAMSLPATRFDLHPMDVHNLCFFLRRHRESRGPRSLRFTLKPDHPVSVIIEPWNTTLTCPRSNYNGDQEAEIRVWGRRRLHILERLIPIAERFSVYLLGSGMPSFYVAHLPGMTFTLGLSGWTANDWSRMGNFDLLAPRADVDQETRQRVFGALGEHYSAKPDALAKQLKLDRSTVLGALSAYTQAGRAIWDLNKDVYRLRELSREPLPASALRFANEREATAAQLVDANAVEINQREDDSKGQSVSGTVRVGSRTERLSIQIDADQRLTSGRCTCNWFTQNKLHKGPCECMLALRMRSQQR